MDSFKSVRALLDAPSVVPSAVSSNENSVLLSALQKSSSSSHKTVKMMKAKKRAAFEAWHRRKLQQIDDDHSKQDEDQDVSSTTIDNIESDIHGEDVPMQTSRTSPSAAVGTTLRSGSSPVLNDQLILSLLLQGSFSSDLSVKNYTRRTSEAKDLTSPKMSRHNDAAYYPNIQCILCKEWVCSRNRYMHIESHLQYRPYRCSICGYDNRKEIFINLHIKRTHGINAKVIYKPDAELEHRAWLMAEQCLQHTRDILTKKEVSTVDCHQSTVKPQIDATLLARYAQQFRPRIFNSQRAEKSQLIEESRQLGLVPDFSEVASRETKCSVCDAHVLGHQSVLEEHVRTHLSAPSYRCAIDGCPTEHHSKNFLTRHMKEVHKYRRTPLDLLDIDQSLISEHSAMWLRSFPDHPSESTARKRPSGCPSNSGREPLARLSVPPPNRRRCSLCRDSFDDDYRLLYQHSKSHLSVVPYQCSRCRFGDPNMATVVAHVKDAHEDENDGHATAVNRMTTDVAQQCHLLLAVCFPDVVLQPWMHDPITVVEQRSQQS